MARAALEAGSEPLVKHGHLAVEHGRADRELCDRRRQGREAAGVVDVLAAHHTGARPTLEATTRQPSIFSS
jgi:hypothetical protein